MKLESAPVRPASSPGGGAFAVSDYYRDAAVRARLCEFLGGASPWDASCSFITADNPTTAVREPRAAGELFDCLDRGFDICRSLGDRGGLLVHLDVEYVNFDHPDEVFRDPERVFALQQPVVETILALLCERAIRPLHVLSGRGHHFVWRIGAKSRVFRRLAEIGRVAPSLREANARPHPPSGEAVPAALGAAFAGLGLVMEHFAHRVLERTARQCAIPIEFTAVEAGPRGADREIVSIDLSEFGDPLHTRSLRVPFSVYHKPTQERWPAGHDAAPIVFLPLQGISVREALEIRRDLRRATELARRVTTTIPDQESGTECLLDEYLGSPLATFHRWFYSEEQFPPEHWPETYDRTSFEDLPLCARAMLTWPNDVLLHPASMRLLTRILLALGWHPRHIAGLITSKFARDFGWGSQWRECDPATRADFYVRTFAGLFATGRDDLIDFNCQSCREEKICAVAECRDNLWRFRESALARRRYDYLAHRPFHGLFLPTAHP